MNNQIIKTEKLIKEFPMGDSKIVALNDLTTSFKKGEFTGFIGPSGSGKTTLLNIIGSLDIPTSGSVEVMGKKVEDLDNKSSAELRNTHIGFIFQTFNLLPVYTVYENVEFPLLLQDFTAEERKRLVMEALEWVGLEDRYNSKPAQLSGGQSQRVAIARAIVKKPEIVLADEPTANLDAKNSYHILETMQNINQNLKTTFLFSTHDEKVIKFLRRKLILEDGKITSDENLKE